MSKYRSQVHPLFPIPVGSYKGFSKQDEIKESLLDLLSSNETRPNSQEPNLRHCFDSSVTGILNLNDSLLQALKSWVLDCTLDFVQEIEGCHCNEMQVISSWCNCADKGASQAPHRHENSWISGTYYITHEEGHAPIQFYKSAALTQPNSAFLSLAKKQLHYLILTPSKYLPHLERFYSSLLIYFMDTPEMQRMDAYHYP